MVELIIDPKIFWDPKLCFGTHNNPKQAKTEVVPSSSVVEVEFVVEVGVEVGVWV